MTKFAIKPLSLAALFLALVSLQATAQQGASECGFAVTDPSVETLSCSEASYVVDDGPNGDETIADLATGSTSASYTGTDLFDTAPGQLGQPFFAETGVAVGAGGSTVTITNRSGATAGSLDAVKQSVTAQNWTRATITPMANGSNPVEVTISVNHSFTIDRPDANAGGGSAGGASSIYVFDSATDTQLTNIECFAQKSATGAPPFAVAHCAAGTITDMGGGKYSVEYELEETIMVTPGESFYVDARDASLITSEGYDAGDSASWSSDNSNTAVFTISSPNANVTFEVAGVEEAGGAPINAGMNDAWYNPATDGQGIFTIVYPDINLMFLAWFTYEADAEGAVASLNSADPGAGLAAVLGDDDHRWLTAAGVYEPGSNRVLTDITITRGGKFDAGDPVTRDNDGTIELIWESCSKLIAKYVIPSINRIGEVELQRVAQDNVELCEQLNQ